MDERLTATSAVADVAATVPPDSRIVDRLRVVCLLVVAGGVVRLTGQRARLRRLAELQRASRFIDVSSGHTAIEQVNRLLSGVIGIPTLLLAIGAFRVRPRRHVEVSTGLVARCSCWSPFSATGWSAVSPCAATCTPRSCSRTSSWRWRRSDSASSPCTVRRPDPVRRRAPTCGVTPLVAGCSSRAVLVLTALALVTGTVVTGTGPHAGDETSRRWGFDISTVAEVHSITVWLAVAIFLALVVVLRRRRGLAAASAGSSRRGCSSRCCRAASATSSTSPASRRFWSARTSQARPRCGWRRSG